MAINLFNFDKQWMSIDTQRYPQKETFNFQDFQNKYWKPVKSSVKSSATLTSRDEVPMTQELTPIKANIQPTTKLVSRSDIIQEQNRGATNLFVDEQKALNNMLRDWIDEWTARQVITERRKGLAWWLTQTEANALLRMQQDGLDSATAIEVLNAQRKKIQQEQPRNIGRELFNVPVWAAALATEQAWNILDFVTWWKYGFKEDVEWVKRANEYLADSPWYTAWRYIAWTWEMIWIWPTSLAKTFGGRVAQWAALGAWFWAATPILEKWSDATMGNIIEGWVIGWVIGWAAVPVVEKVAIPAIAWTLNKGKKYWTALIKGWTTWVTKSVARDINKLWQSLKKWTTIPVTQKTTREIPQAIIKRDLWFTPTERAKIEKITWMTEGQYILSKNLGWKWKEELAEFFDKQASDMYNGISQKLKSVDIKVNEPAATEALNDILEQLTSKPKLARAYAKDIKGIQDMLAKWEYTLDELNNIRRAYDKVNTWIYTAKWEIKSWLEANIDADIRRKLNNTIQKEAKKYWIDVKAMNTELRAWIELKDALLRRLSQEERNNFIWLQDLWVSAILSWWNPVAAVATIWAKKYGEELAPSIAQKLYNLNKSKNVPSRMTRGNTIVTSPKSSKLGLTPSSMNNTAKSPKVAPTPLKKWVLSEREKSLITKKKSK